MHQKVAHNSGYLLYALSSILAFSTREDWECTFPPASTQAMLLLPKASVYSKLIAPESCISQAKETTAECMVWELSALLRKVNLPSEKWGVAGRAIMQISYSSGESVYEMM